MPNRRLEGQTLSARIRHPQASRDLNALIDAALLDPHRHETWALARAFPRADVTTLCERVRRRATVLARRARTQASAILEARDRLIQALYARDSPRGWCTAWCDGSGAQPGAVGGVLADAHARVTEQWSRLVPARDPFATEIAALATAFEIAAAHGAARLRVYTDCVALVRLWHEHRADARLAVARACARQLAHVQLRALPRLHNQLANRLARAARARRR